MNMSMRYSFELTNESDLYKLYETLGWNDFLGLSQNQLVTAMKQSFFVVYAYEDNKLVGMGRIVSDGVINAYLCGLSVLPEYRGQGIGTEISRRLIAHCKEHNLHIQLFCEEEMVPYYEKMGFGKFAVGLKM